MRTVVLLSAGLWAAILLTASCATKPPVTPARHGWQPTNMPIRGHEHVHRGVEQKISFVDQTST